MSLFRGEIPELGRVDLPNGVQIISGTQTTRAGVLAEVGTSPAIGSIYASTAGKQYVKVANANAATDWQRVTATAAD